MNPDSFVVPLVATRSAKPTNPGAPSVANVKAVYGSGYMDGGSVFVLIIDRSARHELSFPIDYDGVIDAHPTAFSGTFDDPGRMHLKNPKRAKEIAIRLIDEFGKELYSRNTLVNDETARVRRALGSRPDTVAVRAFEKAMKLLR